MAIGDTDVELQFTNVVANVPVVVGIQNTGVQTEILVRYGIQRFTATLGVDYALVFPVDLLTFQLTPTQSLIDKITAAGSTNVIFVRRDLPLTSDFDYDNAFVRQKLVDEFNRVWMTLQQQNYRIGLASPVTSWNTRIDDVYLYLSDITAVGGAPNESPSFTGYPASTTPVHGDTSTRIATTAFTADAIYTAVTQNAVTSFNGRQGTVNLTWTDVSNVGGAPIASPVFTGNPQAPTPTLGDNDTSIATTAFVQAALASGVAGVTSWNSRTGVVTMTLADVTGVGGAAASAIPIASTTTPLMAGVGAVGSGTTWARADHVHPTDIGAASVAVSDTPPAIPPQGKLWFDSVGGQLYVRYDDGTSAQWVIAVNNPPDLANYATISYVDGKTNVPIGSYRNLLRRNGGFEVWQRGAGGSASFAVAANAGPLYHADGWYSSSGANQAYNVTQSTGVGGSQYCAHILRTAGQTGVTAMSLGFPLDADELRPMLGQFVRLSFWMAAGANWSPTSGNLSVNLLVGTGTPVKANAGFTGQTAPINIAQSIVTTWTRYQFNSSVIVPATTRQAEVFFSWTPTGTAGADDGFYIDDVQLEVVPAATGYVSSDFERLNFEEQLLLCQRHYQKTFRYEVAPTNNMGSTTGSQGELLGVSVRAGAGFMYLVHRFNPPMRIAPPTVTLYNPAAANGEVRDTVAGADCTGSSAQGITSQAMRVNTSTVATTALSNLLAVHLTAEAGI